jgi:hypothetical protein
LHFMRARLVRRHHGILAMHALPHWHALTGHGCHLGVHLPRYASFTYILPISILSLLPSVSHSGIDLLYRVNNDTKADSTYSLHCSTNESNQLLGYGKRKGSRLGHKSKLHTAKQDFCKNSTCPTCSQKLKPTMQIFCSHAQLAQWERIARSPASLLVGPATWACISTSPVPHIFPNAKV